MKRIAFLPFFALLCLVACSSNPSAQEVVDRASPAICTKIQECNGAQFDAAYPGGVDDCVARTKSTVAQQYGGDLSKTSVCSDDEVDSCMNALESEACPADGSLPSVPCNC